MSYLEYLIYEASEAEYRAAMAARSNYLESLRNELRARGIHPRHAELILADEFRNYFSGNYHDQQRGNEQLDDDRDRFERFINRLRNL